MDLQVCVIKNGDVQGVKRHTHRQTHTHTDRKVKTEGPNMMCRYPLASYCGNWRSNNIFLIVYL